MTRPDGRSASTRLRTLSSSSSTSADSVLALAPARSNNSQATPSASRASLKCFHEPTGVAVLVAWGPSSMRRSFITSRIRLSILDRLDQYRTAKAATDALGGDAALLAKPLQRIDEVQGVAVAAG